jgi:undecaprenyl-phosphate galactose phosphotransferase
MKTQDTERSSLTSRRAEALVPAADTLVVVVALLALRPAILLLDSVQLVAALAADAFVLTWIAAGGLSAILLLLWSHHAGHYDRRRAGWSETRDVLSWVLLLASFDLGLCLIGGLDLAVPIPAWLAVALAVPLLRRQVRRRLDRSGLWRRPTVVVGVGDNAERAARGLFAEPALGLAVVAFADPNEGRPTDGGGIRPVPRMIEVEGEVRPVLPLSRLIDADGGDAMPHVVIAPDPLEMPACVDLFERLAAAGREVDFFPPLGRLPVADARLARLVEGGVASIRLGERLSSPFARLYKRAFDVVVGGAILALTAPLFLILTAAVLIADGRPVLFQQRRVGMNGRPFACLKFRTMVTDADARLQALLASDPAARAEWEETRKLRKDPRISRLGCWLRRTSLDELPQLLNVLRGEMSLIGPRPVVEDELDRYGPRAAFYLKTRPGLSGLWQVSGRSDVDYGRRVELDCRYVRNWSPWWDIALLLATVRVVFSRRGAY